MGRNQLVEGNVTKDGDLLLVISLTPTGHVPSIQFGRDGRRFVRAVGIAWRGSSGQGCFG